MQRWLSRILFLEDQELSRLLPFFVFYFVLFSALSLADGFSLALFLEELGKNALPTAYMAVGIANLVLMTVYILVAEKLGSVRAFFWILLGTMILFGGAWLALGLGFPRALPLSVLFAGREITFTIVIMHFGTLLQDYFTRDELNRVLPVVYAGGRIGGILGGFVLERLASALGLLNLIGVFLAILGLGTVLLAYIAGSLPLVSRDADHLGDPGVAPPRSRHGNEVERRARESLAGFLVFVWASPLLFWSTVTMLLFMMCRWILSFQYSSFFQDYFGGNDVALAQFLGFYTQLALAGSLIVQLVLVNRLIGWIGIKGAYLVYSTLMLLGTSLTLLPMTLGLAVFARLVESELRFGLRNPINMLITNKFSKLLRIRVRAWNLGTVIPLSTLFASAMLNQLLAWNLAWLIPWMGGVSGLAYFLTSFGLLGSFRERSALGGREESPSPDLCREAEERYHVQK